MLFYFAIVIAKTFSYRESITSPMFSKLSNVAVSSLIFPAIVMYAIVAEIVLVVILVSSRWCC